MSDKVTEYKKQQELTAKLLQGAKDEIVTKLVDSIENTFKIIQQLNELDPEYKIAKLSAFRKLAAKFGLAESAVGETKTGKRGKGKGAKAKTVFKLSDEKAKEILDFIGAGEKSTKEIAKELKTTNPSNALTYLKEQGKIQVAKKVGLKKFWKRA